MECFTAYPWNPFHFHLICPHASFSAKLKVICLICHAFYIHHGFYQPFVPDNLKLYPIHNEVYACLGKNYRIQQH